MTRRVVSSSFQRFIWTSVTASEREVNFTTSFPSRHNLTLQLSPRSATLKKSFPFLAEAQAINRMKFHLPKREREHREDS